MQKKKSNHLLKTSPMKVTHKFLFTLQVGSEKKYSTVTLKGASWGALVICFVQNKTN